MEGASQVRAFIGSSSESYDRYVVPFRKRLADVARRQGLDISPKTWRDAEIQKFGCHIMDWLGDQLQKTHVAIFFFAADDERESRNKVGRVPRDNVVFEYGMFYGKLGASRTVMLLENGVAAPTDFDGVLQHVFHPPDFSSDFDAIALELVQDWKSMFQKGERTNLQQLGFSCTIEDSRSHLLEIETEVSAGRLVSPVVFGTEACLNTYVEALSLVQRRFWTTTFFTSGFWKTDVGNVLLANEKMMSRLSGRPDADVRRLFLLPDKFDKYVLSEGQRFSHLQRIGDEKGIEEIEFRLKEIVKYIDEMERKGCRVRLAHDDSARIWTTLTAELRERSDPEDTELAVFDNFRIDMYRGGSLGSIARVSAFPETFANFPAHLDAAERYFESLWEGAEDAANAIQSWLQTVERWKWRIDYQANWIAKYEYDLETRDRDLKNNELKAALGALQESGMFGKVASYIDVGTCTARYPIQLSLAGALQPGARVVALDEDSDCISFSRAKIAENKNIRHRISLVEADFLRDGAEELSRESFDLITCMLGTLSHFGGPRNSSGRQRTGRLQSALDKMNSILKHDGLLLLGNWSDKAKNEERFLRIYRAQDAARLRDWTPSQQELKDIALNAGLLLCSICHVEPDPGIDLLVFRKPPGVHYSVD